MLVHLGADTVISDSVIVGVFDMDTSTVNKATRDFLSTAEKEKRVKYVNFDLPKSFVVCDDNTVIICSYNSEIIRKRCGRQQTK